MLDANRCYVNAMSCLVMNYGEFGSIRFMLFQNVLSTESKELLSLICLGTSTNTLDLNFREHDPSRLM